MNHQAINAFQMRASHVRYFLEAMGIHLNFFTRGFRFGKSCVDHGNSLQYQA